MTLPVRTSRLMFLAVLSHAVWLASARADAGACVANAAVIATNCVSLSISTSMPSIEIQSGATVSGANRRQAVGIGYGHQIGSFTNNGTLDGGSSQGFFSGSRIATFNNHGRILGDSAFVNNHEILEFNNLGSIVGSSVDIHSNWRIVTLNNLQGGADPLTLSTGLAPQNYNIVIRSPLDYGKLDANNSAGTLTFGVHASSTVDNGRYEDVLLRLPPSQLVSATGTFGRQTWSLVYDALDGSYDLVFTGGIVGPSAADTLASLQTSARSLRGVFGVAAARLNPGLSHDCSAFGANGLCVAATARRTSTQGPVASAQAGVVTLAYQVRPHLRLGGFVEQQIGSAGDASVQVRAGDPDLGVFVVWNANADRSGLQFRAAHRQGDQAVVITRAGEAASEPGSGDSSLKSRGTQLTLSHNSVVDGGWVLSPYLGVRVIGVQRRAYSEQASALVTMPLSYGTLSQRSTSVLMGSQFIKFLTERTSLFGHAGVEHDTSNHFSDFAATGATDLQTFNFNEDLRRDRAVLSVGAAYRFNKDQTLSAQWVYREEVFTGAATRTLLAGYQAAF